MTPLPIACNSLAGSKSKAVDWRGNLLSECTIKRNMKWGRQTCLRPDLDQTVTPTNKANNQGLFGKSMHTICSSRM
jgi:hypothetical protein